MTPLAGVGFVCVLLARKYTLIRSVVRVADQGKPGSAGSDEKRPTTPINQLEGRVDEADTSTESGINSVDTKSTEV